jgi:hypothetical protein
MSRSFPPVKALGAVRYASEVQELFACPFCRELFTPVEGPRCPQCDVELVPLRRLPPSLDVLSDQAARGEPVSPEDVRLPLTFWRRGRGALFALSCAGLALFFSPWVEITSPRTVTLSGFDLARGTAGWLWGGALGYFLLVPLVLSRRSVWQLRGARVIATVFAAMTLVEVAMLALVPPAQHRLVKVVFELDWGLYASGLVSVLATAISVRLGGGLRDMRDLGPAPQTSDGELVH